MKNLLLILVLFVISTQTANSQDAFITTWQTTTDNETITIPTTGSGYNYDVNWGDGNTSSGHTGDATHSYVTAGNYQVSISGGFPRIYFNNSGDKDKIISIDQWGDQVWTSMANAFAGCENLGGQASDVPNLSIVTDISVCFFNCDSFNQDIGNWNVSNVTNMNNLFMGADIFNQDIASWDVSNVTSLNYTFSAADQFNQDISTWDVSSVSHFIGTFSNNGIFNQDIGSWNVSNAVNMQEMFLLAVAFNQDLGSWNVSNVTDMEGMFQVASSFNQHLNLWEVSNVTNMQLMFGDASSFNGNISSWDVSNVGDFKGMFHGASAFNQDIGNWEVANAWRMNYMFYGSTSFNQDISLWNVNNVTDMFYMFHNATVFNQDIGSWDVSNVANMGGMFRGSGSFNQDIGSWNVGSVLEMQNMFQDALLFNQTISLWDVSKVSNMENMFLGTTLSTENYDALLIGWNELNLQPNVNFHGGNSTYCLGEIARMNMIASDGWTFTDGGEQVGCIVLPSCTTLTSPLDGSTEVYITTDLTWETIVDATGYKLKIGTTSGGNNLYNMEDVGNVTTFNPTNFPCSSTIYVTITPYNTDGDAIGCTEESFTTEDISAGVSSDVSICTGSSTQLNATGGTVYSWSPTSGLSDPNISNPMANPTTTTTYTVTVSTGNGCEDTDEVIVTVNPNPVANASATDETGNDFNDGTATCAPSGGTPVYSYAWSNGETTQTITNLPPTTYTVTVTDANTCTGEETVTVNEYICPIITVNVSATDETGNDFNDGTATTNPSGGTPPYTYSWSNNETSQTITGLSPGSYTVTVTDSKNCSEEQTVNVNEFVCPTLTIISTQEDASCFELCDGTISVTGVTNGVAPFTYLWSNSETGSTIDNLCDGTYSVTVTDAVNCSVSESFTISEPTEVIPNASATNESGNGFNDGTATASPTGGTPPYEYEWSNGETTQTIDNLSPDDYTVTVTDDNGCTGEETVTVNEFICPTLEVEAIIWEVSCNGECDGAITIDEIVNGVSPFTYIWSNGDDELEIANLCPDDYTVTVTDAVNCEVIETFTVTEPDELFANATSTDETGNNLEDGTAEANSSGGTTPYSYEWSNGETTQSIDNLAPDTYTVTVSDDHGCESIESVVVEEFICPVLTIESSQIDVECYDDCTGYIEITEVTNGTAPFTYEWSDGQTTATATDLCAGDYDVTITDAVNCEVVSGWITIDEPEELYLDISSTDETCYQCEDGTATVSASGGTPPYEYEWSNGETTQSIDNLPPDTYTITVTDYNNCEIEDWIIVEEFECPTLFIDSYQEDITCFDECDGLIEVIEISEGTPPFTYEWSNGETGTTIDNLCAGTYGVTITDVFNCEVSEEYEITEPDELFAVTSATDETSNGANDGTATSDPTGGTSPYYYEWSTGATTQSIGNLSPGEYTVTVTDYYDCESLETVTVNEFSCSALDIVMEQVDVFCYDECDGSLTITIVTNGTAPFSYSWSNGASTEEINDLCAGEYSVTITDAVNCTVEETYIITEPSELLANATSTDETSNAANDGTATANPSGGTESYTYSWSNGSTEQTITGLSPGAYTVTVTDNNGCESIETVNVAEFGCQGLSIQNTIVHNQCFGDCVGSIEITGVDGGQSPFTYTWGDGTTESSLTELCTGTYNVTVVDGNNCSVLGAYTIETPYELTVNINSTDESANESNDGSATANPVGGTQPYTYLWSNSETTQAISGLSPGDYTLTITDVNDCTVTGIATIAEYICPTLEIASTVNNASCFEECDGIITAAPTGGTNPYIYTWSNGASTTNNGNLCEGDYSVTITDSKNCSIEQTYSIIQPNEMIITVDEIVDFRVGLPGSISITTNDTYTFDWTGDNGYKSTEEDISGLEIGCYTLVVTDPATECSVDTTICVDDLTATNDWKELSVNVYPNPVDKILTIDFGEAFDKEINVSITDLSGSQIKVLSKNGTDKKLMLDTKAIDSGIYMLKLQVEGKYLYKKIVVIH